ncbi:peptidoglycan-binding protein [Streptomyces odontomachi]|uniref:peptidoglycan-binding protein n=1 Tax=Streptomyces odontomachi TaxID=2944940 RepID=UPI00210DB21C|nr:peptidoglycan-binding protein [Streptomyces sp. ODS25]
MRRLIPWRCRALEAAPAALLVVLALGPAAHAVPGHDAAGRSTRPAATSGALLAGPSADQLRAKTATCGTQISSGMYAENAGGTRSIPICGKSGAVFWTADLDVDCDGQRTDECNPNTDPYYQSETACVESDGDALNSATLPHIVVPLPSSIWDHTSAGINCGTVGAVIYQDRVVYGVIGDKGPTTSIGEASYAMAEALGIDPDPSSGGVGGKVVGYVMFPGTKVSRNEDHAQATQLGEAAATTFVQSDSTCDDVSLDATRYPTIAAGSNGVLVQAAQCLLKGAGFDPKSFKGTFDADTEAAVKGFQADAGLPASGEVDAHTWTALLSHGSTPTLQDGSSGTAVQRLQRALTAALGTTVAIDGLFGPNTTAAVEQYQSAHGLTADGIVGANTWGALQAGK